MDFPDFGWEDRQAARVRDDLRVAQRDYLNNRKAMLKNRTELELTVDAAQIAGIAQIGSGWGLPTVNSQQSHPFELPPPTDYVLEDIHRIVQTRLPQEVIQDVNNNCLNPDWVNTEYYPGLYDDRPRYGNGDINHPEYRLWFLMQLCVENTGANDENWRTLMRTFEFHAHLFHLKRFADKRNPETSVRPQPDGQNLTDANLRVSWVLHRAFLRALHYRSLKVGREKYGISQLEQITQLSVLLHCVEVDHIKAENRVIPDYFHAVVNVYDALQDKLQAIADWMFTEERAMIVVPWTIEETIRHKIAHPDRLGQIIDQNLHIGPENREWQFWAQLFNLAEDFEDRMAVEHVEDVLIDKRVVIEDEEWQAYQTLIEEGVTYTPRDLQDLELAGQELIAPRLRKIGQINRYRRNHLLLKDWNRKRPWRRLFYVFDTSDNGQYSHYRQLIHSFYGYGFDLEDIPQPSMAADSPSRIANIWEGFFPIQPIASHSLYYPDMPSPMLENYSGGCVICQEDFIPGETLAQLHCIHLFHYTCIRSSWDNDRRYKMDCPLCRQNWVLREVADIEPETLDVWDNERHVGALEAMARPDIGDDYEELEEGRLVESEDWADNWWRGPLVPRSVSVELAHLRRRRQARNAQRRMNYRYTGQGMQAYGNDAQP